MILILLIKPYYEIFDVMRYYGASTVLVEFVAVNEASI